MPQHKKNARRALESGRANDPRIDSSLARAVLYSERKYDRAREAPEEWARGCRGFGIMLCIAWGLGVMWGVLA